ncbi:Uu.00g046340.m01.CDS01 [Anthostomella pinea]|uniref:Uu.00g046340.m01.CDS01 n=1 Tax=Anthostomella pinea TaxID=933095 RepID=A0AAI8YEE3_9PEZI|nr:Uu.00g046340.m01.CDS01 [Anthostomella pinea]
MSSSQASADTRADSEPPPKRHQPDLPSTSPRALMRASSDIGPRTTSEQKSLITVAFLDVHGFTYESLELRAPKPPTSVLHLEPPDLVTPSLQKLARALEIPKRFRPKEQKRDLRPFERGHWLLDCSSWEPQLRRDAWAYLANYIGTGVAGWGIWCKRDPEFQWLRTYCFGGVAAHIYLLLYLASQRTILYTGSTWVDGDRIEVITMGARDKQ